GEGSNDMPLDFAGSLVAQVFNLLYRRFPIGGASVVHKVRGYASARWKPAMQPMGNLRYGAARNLLVVLCTFLWSCQGQAATQTYSLAAQWNLITFQLVPDNPDPAEVFSTLPGFQAAWTYDASLAIWQRYIKPAG